MEVSQDVGCSDAKMSGAVHDFQYVKVSFTHDEMRKIVRESTRSRRLIADVIKDTLEYGLENYRYTKASEERR